MTLSTNEVSSWVGRTACEPDGGKIGRIEDIYLDEETGQPEWVAIATGMFGSKVTFAPITGATSSGDDVILRFTKDQVKDAPNADADGALSQEEEARLYSHYGMNYSEFRSDSGLPEGGRENVTTGYTERTDRDRDGDETITRSEEELRLSKSTQEAGRVRLRKWVETERVQESVPVTKETVRVEREPITDGAVTGGHIGEDDVEVVLHEETVTAEKQVVGKERITLDKDTVTEQEQVSVDLRKEHVEIDDDANVGRTNR